MIDWQAIILAFINGPGTSFAAMVIAFFVLIGVAILISGVNRRKDIVYETEEKRRGDQLSVIASQLSRVQQDQNEIAKQIETRPASRRRRRDPPIIEGEAQR